MQVPPSRESTASVHLPGFRPHGHVEFWADGQILFYEGAGPYNRELFDALGLAQFRYLAAHPFQGPWAIIGTFFNSVMASPEAMLRYREQAMVMFSQPVGAPVATAFVVTPNLEGAAIMTQQVARIYSDLGRPFRCFAEQADARRWVDSVLTG